MPVLRRALYTHQVRDCQVAAPWMAPPAITCLGSHPEAIKISHTLALAWYLAHDGTFLDDKTLQMAIRRKSHLPAFCPGQTCEYVNQKGEKCGQPLDSAGAHTMTCSHAWKLARHNRLRDCLAKLLKTSG
eukprot:1047565-Amphidinium_carterae.1